MDAIASDGSTPAIIAAENGHAGILRLLGNPTSNGGSSASSMPASPRKNSAGKQKGGKQQKGNGSRGSKNKQRHTAADFDATMDGGATASYIAACNGHAEVNL